MLTSRRNAFVPLFVIAAILISSGCSDDPVKPARQPVEFEPLTTPENLIHNLVLSYDKLDIARYAELLLSTTEGGYGQEYYWFFQGGDAVVLGEDFITREVDIERTGNMFLAAKGTPAKPEHPVIEKLQLEINDGAWAEVDSLWGEPCDDCWHTMRQYYISIVIGHDTICGDHLVQFYVVPVQEGDVTTYRIALAYDIYQ